MTVDDLMKHFDCRLKQDLATKIGLHKSMVSYWIKNGIPYSTQCAFEVDTNGKLKAQKVELSE